MGKGSHYNKHPLCKCGCGKPVKWCNQKKRWNTFLIGHCFKGKKYSPKWKPLKGDTPLCKCGCGEPVMRSQVSPYNWNTYLVGHENKGRKRPEEFCKTQRKRLENPENCPFNGKKHTKDSRQKMSESHKKLYENPENHPNWKGGISPYPCEFRKIREIIRERDNHICQLCEKIKQPSDRNLDVHHIDYNTKNNSPKNLISLCHPCNRKVDVKGKREFWQPFFEKKIESIYKKRVE